MCQEALRRSIRLVEPHGSLVSPRQKHANSVVSGWWFQMISDVCCFRHLLGMIDPTDCLNFSIFVVR